VVPRSYGQRPHVRPGAGARPLGALEFATGIDAWRGGVNRLQLDFARVRSPAEVRLSGDTRPLAAALDYIRVQKR
jgi:hypothetical protein